MSYRDIFGFVSKVREKDREKQSKNTPNLIEKEQDDGAITVQQGGPLGGHSLHVLDIDGVVKDENELIKKYREVAKHPEIENAIEDIVNEAIVLEADKDVVSINTDRVELSENIKKKIREEFDHVCTLLNFEANAYQLFRKWYVDGRIVHHIVAEENTGISQILPVDPCRIKKIREIEKKIDNKTQSEVTEVKEEYYMYSENGVTDIQSSTYKGLKLSLDSVVMTGSGLLDQTRKRHLSYLDKAIRPINQLRLIEDAIVIYRISRAPERRAFYVDCGNRSPQNAEKFMVRMMNHFKNQIAYDASTGELTSKTKHLSMLEDFWLPRFEGRQGTQIETLQGGQNLGDLEDVKYFQQKLYRSLNVPVARLDSDSPIAGLGRSSEITREELKFAKFVFRLKMEFAQMLNELTGIQLTTKKILTMEEWKEVSPDLNYDFNEDSFYSELKDAEIMNERIRLARDAEEMREMGYYSKETIRKKILRQTDEEIEEIAKQIKEDEANGEGVNNDEEDGEDLWQTRQ